MRLRENILISIIEKYLIGLLTIYVVGWILFVFFFLGLYILNFIYNTLDFIVYYTTGLKFLRPSLENRKVRIKQHDVFIFAVFISYGLWYFKIEKPQDDEQKAEQIADQRRVDSVEGVGNFANYTENTSVTTSDNSTTTQPLTAQDYFNRGNEVAYGNNYQGAILEYDKAIELDPKNADYYCNRGIAEHQMGNNPGACMDWQKAAQLGSQYAIGAINEFCDHNLLPKIDTIPPKDTIINKISVKNITVSKSSSLLNGLIAYYPFTDNANDVSDNRNTTVVNGAILTKDRFGNENSAYRFNNSYIEIPKTAILNLTNQLCIAAWTKLDQYRDNQNFVSRSNTVEIDPYVSYSLKMGDPDINNKVQFQVCINGVEHEVHSNQSIPLNTWVFLVGLYNGSSLQIYINGILDNSLNVTGNITNFNTNLNIGRWSAGAPTQPQYLTGSLDDIRLYNRALTQPEITFLANH